MIGCFKKIKVKPGKEREFENLFHQLKAEMALHEPGNEYYDLYKSADSLGHYVIMERYHNKEALTMHEQSAHGARLFPHMRALLESLEKDCFESVE